MFMATARPGSSRRPPGLVLVELGLGDPDGLVEVVVGQLRVDDLVAVLQEGRLDAARDRLPAVKEEDFHEDIVYLAFIDRRSAAEYLQALQRTLYYLLPYQRIFP